MFFCQIKPVVVNHAAANRNQAVISGKLLQNPVGWFQLGLEQNADVVDKGYEHVDPGICFQAVLKDAGKTFNMFFYKMGEVRTKPKKSLIN